MKALKEMPAPMATAGNSHADLMKPLVTVVIPAFNAEDTIVETLQSVLEQTYRDLEILVIDDGSTDSTRERVQQFAEADPRIRLIRQVNSGVASARNRGIAEAKADFIAPIDADDLWMPTKIEKQLAAMLSRGAECGLVYTGMARIDEHGNVLSIRKACAEGRVLTEMLAGNLVGGGSPALLRKRAIIECGGYDTSMRGKNAQGCEDYKLYLRISERYEFAAIKEHLTGYRKRAGAMSTDLLQMARSHRLVAEYACQTYPRYFRIIREGLLRYYESSARKAARYGQFRCAALLLVELLRLDPWYALVLLLKMPFLGGRRIVGRPRSPFDDQQGGSFLSLGRQNTNDEVELRLLEREVDKD